MNTLVIDIGGTNVKVWKTNESDKVKFPSGQDLTPQKLVDELKHVTAGWAYDRASIGYPGDVLHSRPSSEPFNLGEGWTGFDFAQAMGVPVRVMNDACMQALGSYEGGRMLYLGLGTSMGSTFVVDKQIIPLALGHLRFCGETFEHFLSRKGLELTGPKRWRRAVIEAAEILGQAFMADYVVLGGGNAKKLEELPKNCRLGGNVNAYMGGLRMWEDVEPVVAPAGLALFPDRRESGT
jgi:polyphosphate glucokinase